MGGRTHPTVGNPQLWVDVTQPTAGPAPVHPEGAIGCMTRPHHAGAPAESPFTRPDAADQHQPAVSVPGVGPFQYAASTAPRAVRHTRSDGARQTLSSARRSDGVRQTLSSARSSEG